MPHLVLIETSGTQAYIFATNRLRQNVGASELCYRVGSHWVLDAVAETTGRQSLWADDSAERRRGLLDPTTNPPLLDGSDGVEVILATSARAAILVSDPAAARSIVTSVTRRALVQAPGLGVAGSIQPVTTRQDLHRAMAEARAGLAHVRATLPGPEQRFLRLPPVASCGTTGLPAASWGPPMNGEAPEALSRTAAAKFAAARLARTRLQSETTISARAMLNRDVGELERDMAERWVAVIHCDGNGMGHMFGQLAARAAEQRVEYASAYRELSVSLEIATLRAFDSALRAIAKEGEHRLPLVPLVLGGDDLTVLCDGQRALPFVRRYLAAFEEECHGDPSIRRWTAAPPTASAGVAIVKPHFPFHTAYDLAEGLLGGAKQWSRRHAAGHAAFDFLLLHDSIGADVSALRAERLTSHDNDIALWAGPYLPDGDPVLHAAAELDRRIEAIQARDPDTGRRRIARSVLHDLRKALKSGREAADARLALLSPGGDSPLAPLLTGGHLWWEEDARLVCPLVDAMDVARLLEDAG